MSGQKSRTRCGQEESVRRLWIRLLRWAWVRMAYTCIMYVFLTRLLTGSFQSNAILK